MGFVNSARYEFGNSTDRIVDSGIEVHNVQTPSFPCGVDALACMLKDLLLYVLFQGGDPSNALFYEGLEILGCEDPFPSV